MTGTQKFPVLRNVLALPETRKTLARGFNDETLRTPWIEINVWTTNQRRCENALESRNLFGKPLLKGDRKGSPPEALT